MASPTERQLTGPEALQAVTSLLRRSRALHPTAGLFEAADFQWWWREARPTDLVPQLLWFDDDARPEAAVVLTDWGNRVALDPLVLPVASPEWVVHVMERGLAHAAELGFETVSLEVSRDDVVLRGLLSDRGFEVADDGVVEAWLPVTARPPITTLADGYRSCTRLDTSPAPHHLIDRTGPDVESRLQQTSLYRADLDLVVLDSHGTPAAYGLFWFDPVTSTGLVEPMRTHDEHQRRGLARHVLTTGIDLLARAGAERIKICFEPGNPASSHLYLDVGFRPIAQTDLLAGPTR